MRFGLVRPCPHCPFRADVPPFIRAEFAAELAADLDGGATFFCHETVEYDDDVEGVPTDRSHHCAGALIVLLNDGVLDRSGLGTHDLLQIAERFGLFDRTRLDLGAPVYPSLAAFVDAHRDSR